MTASRERKIRVLIVDDSAFMRTAIERMLKQDPDVEVIGSASNGREAVEKTVRLHPDVLTMDVEMPVMDGLHAVKEIMKLSPTPIVMVSSLTLDGARVTLDALELGAVDYVAKPGSTVSLNIMGLQRELLIKVRAAAEARPQVSKLRIAALPPKGGAPAPGDAQTQLDWVVLIGASTGGPPAIQQILTTLPPNLTAPVIIAQHMPRSFTATFAQRLNALCPIRVKEAVDGEVLQRSVAYICPGDQQTRFCKRPDGRHTFSIAPDPSQPFAPCIDVTFFSGAETFGKRIIGVILTGMGNDGVRGLKNIHLLGGLTIAQDRATSVVYGMPRAALEERVVTRILPIHDIAKEIDLALKGGQI